MQLWPAVLYSGGHKETQKSQGCGDMRTGPETEAFQNSLCLALHRGEVSGMGLGLQTPLVMGCSGISQKSADRAARLGRWRQAHPPWEPVLTCPCVRGGCERSGILLRSPPGSPLRGPARPGQTCSWR